MPRDKQAILCELLVLRCKRGEREAYDQLVREWEGRLFYYIRRLVESEADAWDVLQQTWLRAFQGIKSLKDAQGLPAWLYRVARCQAATRWREHHREQAHIEESGDVAKTEVSDDSRFDDAEAVHRGLEAISLAHREVLTLFFLEDLTLAQLADVLDVPLGTVKSRLWHAKRALRAVLDEPRGTP